MSTAPFDALSCPLDGDPLSQQSGVWSCAQGHTFDIARQGYVHLLPVQHKRSRDPGDSKAMVAARQRFLNAGHYERIAQHVTQAVWANATTSSLSCLDAGCGEGYYLRQLAQLSAAETSLSLVGVDISKWAVLAAAKADQNSTWVVGSNAHLPIQAQTLDRVLCMFGFPVYTEFARVLKSGGELIQVDAGPDHLRELREVIYPVLKAPRPASSEAPEGFTQAGQDTLRYTIDLADNSAIADLLTMTPHLYRASAEGRARAAALTSLTLTVDVVISRLTRH
ncbi:rRNA (guanine-N1)-methyltransferase [Terasakiispira papahanaumokuakeensis]|uniref:rRNA (Guanine-N1)-methyltransferase n=1 Tax=Terasakiispira papahanaumokuakeensis TaxID=197479 RepID=A0A1E2V5R7_9GAMM|nr:methyltransferase domain-containing protein [Terasakiispira papahanaumokuakeensis]ODC02263.1 rRNA (guanine-N1)-methyltransferase [Terasakiispira papahanaumokuakeensis]